MRCIGALCAMCAVKERVLQGGHDRAVVYRCTMNKQPCHDTDGVVQKLAVADEPLEPQCGHLVLALVCLPAGSLRTGSQTEIGRARVNHLQDQCAYRRADSVRRFNVGRVLGLNRPISVYCLRRALTLCTQLCMGILQAGARFPALTLTLCPQLCMGIPPRRHTEIGLLSPPLP